MYEIGKCQTNYWTESNIFVIYVTNFYIYTVNVSYTILIKVFFKNLSSLKIFFL